MVEYSIVSAEEEHLEEVARNMRLADQNEIWASHRVTPEAAIDHLRVSRDTRAGLADGQPVCIFGIDRVSVLSMVGHPWLLGTEGLHRHGIAFLRRNKEYLDEAKEGFEFLYNYVDARNVASIAWLRWLGFEVKDAEPYGWLGMPFHRFQMETV